MHNIICSDNVVLNGNIEITSSIASFYVAEERMVRHYKRKVETRAAYGDEALREALARIRQGEPLLRVSRDLGIPARTIRRHRDKKVKNPGVVQMGAKSILSSDVEMKISEHVQAMEKSMYGLTPTQVRRLAYDMVEALGIKNPFNSTTKLAGKDWLMGFLNRHPALSIRQPQATNIARAVGFNKPQVERFYGIYRELVERHEYEPSKIWNMDETGITCVHRPGKIVASKGVRQVAKITSGERGKTVTVICAMSAVGTYLPPLFIFPRKRMVDLLMNGAPPQSIGLANPSGWTDSEIFIDWLKHFVKFTNSSTTNRHVIVLDGHHSHKTLAAVEYARAHGIDMVTLPPHCTHKMQPLDRTFFKSLKSAYAVESDTWMVSNPGKRISFYQMAGIFGTAYVRTSTQDKAINGFKSCGLWPFDNNIFRDEDFAAAELTEEARPVVRDIDQMDADVQPVPDNMRHHDQDAYHDDPAVVSTADALMTAAVARPSIAGLSTAMPSTTGPSIAGPLSSRPSPAGSSSAGPPTARPSSAGSSTAGPSTAGPSTDRPSTARPSSAGPSTARPSSAGPSIPRPSIAVPSTQLHHVDTTVSQVLQERSPLPRITMPRPRTRKAETAACVTSSPYKRTLQDKADGKRVKTTKKKYRMKSKSKPNISDSSDDEEWPCVVCGETFATSKPREKWVKCQLCQKWAHEECTPGEMAFICPNCDSDDD